MSTKYSYSVSNGGVSKGAAIEVINNEGVPNLTGIKVIKESFTLSDFTDGGGAAGTVEFASNTLPIGAVVVRTLIEDVTGFIGDTSAVITVGDGTDVDRYNTGTPSVFADIDAVDAGAVSGTAYHAAAKTPTITVTSGTDFGSVTDGALTVAIAYYKL